MSIQTSTQSKTENQHPAFICKRIQHIDSLNVTIEEYEHKLTGALHYHLAADNNENVFLVALRTLPQDSSGVAHILEHTALCGSKHYPVRDPFFMMIRRSLNTFMNAFTSSDWTAYPFASQNRKDFNNLMDVYLDSVFFSNLNKLDFMQEGHRVEFEQADNPESDLVYKGVVFNEMKGAMASPVSTLWQTLTKHLFPTTTYHHNSGGDPEHIPDLSYEQFREFYRIHYHPSNAIFMTYGDIPALEHQQKFEQQVLSKFEKLDVHLEVPPEKRYHAPVRVQEYYALDEEDLENKTHIVMGWLLGESINMREQMQAHLLSGILLDNSASPLLKALETTELGSSPSPLCGVETSNMETTFMCGLEGSNPQHQQAVEQLVNDVLTDVAENGVPYEQVESVLHQLELEQREITGGGYPYGLQLILEGLSLAVHHGDPVAALDLDPVLSELREQIKDPDFVKQLVRNLLLQNQHRVTLTMAPDANFSQHRQQAEVTRLAQMKSKLSETDKQNVVDMAAKLAERQSQEDDESILPKVGLEDIPEQMHIAEGETAELKKQPLTIYKQGTNGLVYQQVVHQLPDLDEQLMQYLPYYTANLTELGCAGKSYLETQAWQAKVSGGVNCFTTLRGKADDINDVSGYVFLSGKSLQRNYDELCKLMQATLEQARFDELERIQELIAQQRAHREQSVVSQGHQLAMSAASAHLSPAALLKHKLSGLAGIAYVKQLDESLKDKNALNQLGERFSQIHQSILQTPRQFLLIGEDHSIEQYRESMHKAWGDTSDSGQLSGLKLPADSGQLKQAWLTSTPVNFCAKAYAAVPMQHEDAPALAVLSVFLRNGFLHTAIREKGGAYGGGASFASDTAAFRFYSYRDPRLEQTLDDFDRSLQWLASEKHEPRQLEEAILGVISSIDKPSSPAGEAKDAFQNQLFGRTPAIRQDYRARILKVTLDDLKRVGDTYLKPEQAHTVVISGVTGREQLGDSGFDVISL